jgi:type II secretory pathway pseudopilin PulG
MKLCPPSRRVDSSPSSPEKGYVLITLILFVALLAIAMTAIAPAVLQQMKRDREEELIHRGTQYSRAIKHYMKKMGAYPNRIEDLESANNIRYLRKRYKDPITGKDFKLLHFSDVQLSTGIGLAGATSAAALATGAGAAGNAFGGGSNTSAFGGGGGFGGATGNTVSGGAFGGNSGGAFGGNSGGAFGGNSGGAFGGSSGGAFGGNSGSAFGAGNSGGAFGGNSGGLFGGTPGQTANNTPGTGADQSQSQGVSGTPQGQSGFGQPVQGLPGFNSQGGANQVIGGGPVVGVASISKDKSIRTFSKKDHYKDWLFIYDPTTDRGGLISTPYQTPQIGSQSVAGASSAGGTPAPNGAPGASNSPFGFGGQQNSTGGFGTPPQAPSMPPNQAPQ